MKSDPLSKKSPSEILALYERYRAGENVRTLLEELELREMAVSQFCQIFSNVRVNDLICPICGSAQMMAKLPSKSNPAVHILYTCQDCSHQVVSDIDAKNVISFNGCTCRNCMDARRMRQEQQTTSFAEKIRNAYKDQAALPYKELNNAPLMDLVGLHALVNTWVSEDMTFLCPLQNKLELFWPTETKSIDALRSIYHQRLVQLDLSHCTTADFKEHSDGTINWDITSASLVPSIRTESGLLIDIPDTRNLLGSLLPHHLSSQQKSDLPLLMRAIAVDECIQYLKYMLDEYGFEPDIGEKTEAVFEELLDQLPVNQILVCIWTAVKNAAAFLQSPSCTGRKHAFNTIHGKLRDAAQRRIAGEFESKGFTRNKNCPRSEISFSLYGLLGFDGDIGFESKLTDIHIPEKWQVTAGDNDNGSDYDYLSFTDEELAMLQSHGFEVLYHFDAMRTLPYSGHTIQLFKIQSDTSIYFEMSVSGNLDGEWFEARLSTVEAVLFYVGAFEKCNQLAETIGQ